MKFSRYAVFYTPPDGPLATFGTAWLGWDITTGRAVAHPAVEKLPGPVADLTRSPRKYGLHATIKPPFTLGEGCDEVALSEALQRLCVQLVPATLAGLRLVSLGRFLALVPEGDQVQLSGLAAMVVETLDTFRAPPGAGELKRRAHAGLSAHQIGLLNRWGYPYVMDAFRFHITLTGKLPKPQIAPVRAMLDQALATALPAPFVIDALSLVGEDADTGQFHMIKRFTLKM